jgi:hypothetical protein
MIFLHPLLLLVVLNQPIIDVIPILASLRSMNLEKAIEQLGIQAVRRK